MIKKRKAGYNMLKPMADICCQIYKFQSNGSWLLWFIVCGCGHSREKTLHTQIGFVLRAEVTQLINLSFYDTALSGDQYSLQAHYLSRYQELTIQSIYKSYAMVCHNLGDAAFMLLQVPQKINIVHCLA